MSTFRASATRFERSLLLCVLLIVSSFGLRSCTGCSRDVSWTKCEGVARRGRGWIGPVQPGRVKSARPRSGMAALRHSDELESRRHGHEFRERVGLHLAHHVASVGLHRDLADTELAADLLVQEARDYERHDLPFTTAE